MFLIMRAVHRGYRNVENRAWHVLPVSKSNVTLWAFAQLKEVQRKGGIDGLTFCGIFDS